MVKNCDNERGFTCTEEENKTSLGTIWRYGSASGNLIEPVGERVRIQCIVLTFQMPVPNIPSGSSHVENRKFADSSLLFSTSNIPFLLSDDELVILM